MNPEHTEIIKRIEQRLNVIENKLDKHLELVAKHETDLNWLKGSFKLGAGVVASVISGLAITSIKVFLN